MNIYHRVGSYHDARQTIKISCILSWYIDIVFVKYGQVGEEKELGLTDGICLEKNPKCAICGITNYCSYEGKAVTA